MQVSKKFMPHCRSLRPYFLGGDSIEFHQWVIQKYRRQQSFVRGFPALLFLRPFRPIIAPDRKNLTVFPIQITLIVPVRERQIVLRKTIDRAWSVQEDLFVSSPITYKPMRLLADATRIAQPKYRSDLNINKVQRPTALSYPMPSAIAKAEIHSHPVTRNDKPALFEQPVMDVQSLSMPSRAIRPAELSYLIPTSVKSKTSRPVRQNGESVFFEKPVMDVQSMTTNSQAPSIDINRLTDQVYQALERKIRLEKQRRGYR